MVYLTALPATKLYMVDFENYFTSIESLFYLKEKSLRAFRTINNTRKHFPDVAESKKMKRE